MCEMGIGTIYFSEIHGSQQQLHPVIILTHYVMFGVRTGYYVLSDQVRAYDSVQ